MVYYSGSLSFCFNYTVVVVLRLHVLYPHLDVFYLICTPGFGIVFNYSGNIPFYSYVDS